MSYFTLAISTLGHNSSFCLLKNSSVELFCQAERITRLKYSDFNDLSNFNSIFLITETIDLLILINFNQEKIEKFFKYLNKKRIKVNKFLLSNDHHKYHAMSGFFMSGFSDAACLVVDGWGGLICKEPAANEVCSIFDISYYDKNLSYKNLYNKSTVGLSKKYEKNNNELLKLSSNLSSSEGYKISITEDLDIGVAYHIFTNHLGFGPLEEGKTMGLSSYGKQNLKYENIFKYVNGEYVSDKNFYIFEKRSVNTKTHKRFKYSNFFEKADLAFSIQNSLEIYFEEKIKKLLKLSNSLNIVISGGCALNIISNTKLIEKFKNYNFFVDPIANDASISLGAAFFHYCKNNSNNVFIPKKCKSISWGNAYSKEEILEEIHKKKFRDEIK